MSGLMLGQIYQTVIRCSVALTSGCERESRESNTRRQKACGTNGQGVPVERTQVILVVYAGPGMSWNCAEDEDC